MTRPRRPDRTTRRNRLPRPRRAGPWLAALTLAAAFAATAACGSRAHLGENHGVQSRAFFERQARAASDGTAQGLDSEEASLIHESYRETLGQKVRRNQDQSSSMLILENGYGTKNKR